MKLNSTSQKLQMLLADAVATNESVAQVGYRDRKKNHATAFAEGSSYATTSGASAVDFLAAPGDGDVRTMTSFVLPNLDTTSIVVTLRLNDGGTTSKIIPALTLAAGDVLYYTEADGWKVIDASGNLKQTTAAGPRSNLTQEDLVPYVIPFTALRVHDAMATNLPGTAANDDMGLITGTPGTDAPTIQGVDFGGTSTDEKAAFEFVLPPEYVAGQTITLRARAGMLTAVSDGTATLDCECWVATVAGAVGSDICATAVQSINSLTFADKDFTITPTGLVPGDRLIVRLSFGGSDTGNLAVMIPEISYLAMLLDIKG